jgi:hypothetical protein
VNEVEQKQPKPSKFIDLYRAKEIYKCAEFKSILNETQELLKINLYFLKTENQKLSFFINLYNLMCIHAKFYLASLSGLTTSKDESDSLNMESDEFLFRNRTEELLFQQRICYKVGQMGCVSLYDLKYHILARRCLNSDTPFNFKGQLSSGPNDKTSKAENFENQTQGISDLNLFVSYLFRNSPIF